MIAKVEYTDESMLYVKITWLDNSQTISTSSGEIWVHSEIEKWLLSGGVVADYPPPSLSQSKAIKQRDISNIADTFLSSMAQEYGAYEKLTWDQQALEADALLSDPDASAPLVRAIATARGMTALEMAGRIAANRAQWVALSGTVVGKRLAYQDALDAAQTVEEVAAIVPVFP